METERERAGQVEEESGQVEEREIKTQEGTSLVVQWLGLHTPSVRGAGSIPGRGTKIPHAKQCDKKKKKDTGGTQNRT